MTAFIEIIDRLYHGQSAMASRFRYGLLAVDLLTVSFFVFLSMYGLKGGWITVF